MWQFSLLNSNVFSGDTTGMKIALSFASSSTLDIVATENSALKESVIRYAFSIYAKTCKDIASAIHYNVTWVSWRLISPEIRLFAQMVIQVNTKDNIKDMHYLAVVLK